MNLLALVAVQRDYKPIYYFNKKDHIDNREYTNPIKDCKRWAINNTKGPFPNDSYADNNLLIAPNDETKL